MDDVRMKSVASAIYVSASVMVVLYILGLLMNNEMRYSGWLWLFPAFLLAMAFLSSDYFNKKSEAMKAQ